MNQSTNLNIFFNNTHKILKKLGSGLTSEVYLAQSISDSEERIAIKIFKAVYFKKEKKMGYNQVQNEISILEQLGEIPNVCKIVSSGNDGYLINNNNGRIWNNLTYIAMEYVEGQELFELQSEFSKIRKDKDDLKEDIGLSIFGQIVETIEHLHQKGIVHRDLKLENILIDKQMNINLIDFGFAQNENIDSLTSFQGTLNYMAPEILLQDKYDGKQQDIFALGVILFGLVTGLIPFKRAHITDQYYQLLISNNLKQQQRYWSIIEKSSEVKNLSSEFKDLIHQILSFDPQNRPSLKEIMQHDFFKLNKIFISKQSEVIEDKEAYETEDSTDNEEISAQEDQKISEIEQDDESMLDQESTKSESDSQLSEQNNQIIDIFYPSVEQVRGKYIQI